MTPTRLTEEQQRAIDAGDGAYLLTAPPGSGKTEVLVRRISRLLAGSRGQTFRILTLTFTNRAADAIRRRIATDIADEEWRLYAGTFHSFCQDLLTDHGEPVGVAPNVTLYTHDDERLEVLEAALRDEGFDPAAVAPEPQQLLDVLRAIDRSRRELLTPEDVGREPVLGEDITLGHIYDAYERTLDRFGGIDFAGLLSRAHRLLSTDAWTAQHYARLYRYLLVDEAQDSSRVQYHLLRQLAGARGNVFVVADPHQSVYAFAGALPDEVLAEFRADFHPEELPLSSNFRSAAHVVEVANQLGRHFDADRPHDMTAHGHATGHVTVQAFDDEGAEAEAIADAVTQLLADGLAPGWLEAGEDPSVTPEQIAILARTRFGLPPVATALDRRGIPTVLRTGPDRFFESRLGQQLHQALRVLSNPDDVPTRRRLLVDQAKDGGAPYLVTPDSTDELLRHALPAKIADLLGGYDAGEAPDALLDALCTVDLVALADPGEADAWAADQQDLARLVRSFRARTPNGGDRTLTTFLAALGRVQGSTVDAPGVPLLTVHAAKGLEFRVVFVVGVTDGQFPSWRSGPGELDDERRNAYVAVTRASRRLALTWPRTRTTRYGSVRVQRPSPFLAEMGLPSS